MLGNKKRGGGGAVSVKLPGELGSGYRLRPLVSSLLQVYLGQKIVSLQRRYTPRQPGTGIRPKAYRFLTES